MKIVLPPGEALVIQFPGSEKLLLVETSKIWANIYTADPHPLLKPPEKIYDKKFTINLAPELRSR